LFEISITEGAPQIDLLDAFMSTLSETQPKLPSRIWERQPGESLKAYNAFRIYRELKRDRSLAAVTAALAASKQRADDSPADTDASQKRKSVKSGQIGLWSRQYNWNERAREWDIEAEKYFKQRSAQTFRSLCDRHVEQIRPARIAAQQALGEFVRAMKDGRNDFQTMSVKAQWKIVIRTMRLLPVTLQAEREAMGVKVIFPKRVGPPVWQIGRIEEQPRLGDFEQPFWNENETPGPMAEELETQIAELPGAEPWSRQPGVSARAYSAFCVYRDLGPARSLAHVTHCCRGRQAASAVTPEHAKSGRLSKTRKSGQVGAWSRTHAWGERCRSWDSYQSAVYEFGVRTDLERQAQKRAELARASLEVALLPILKSVRSVEQRKQEFGRMPASKLYVLNLRLMRHLPALLKYERKAAGIEFVHAGNRRRASLEDWEYPL
jgi:hypothetical protein